MRLYFKRILNNKVIRISNNNLFQRQRFNFFNFNSSKPTFLDKNQRKVEEFYEPNDELTFIDGRCLISESQTNQIRIFKYFQLFLVTPLNILFAYKFIQNLIYFRLIKSLLWGILCMMATRLNYGIHNNLYHFVDKIYLLEDGIKTEFTFHNTKKAIVTDNINIRKANQKELLFIINLAPNVFDKFIPIIINEQIYFLAKENEISNKGVFSAMMNGNYIKKCRDKNEKIIDIK